MRWRTDPPPADSPKTVTLPGSPPKHVDVVAHPAQRLDLVEQPAVRRDSRARRRTRGTDAVGHGHDDDTPRRERGAVVERDGGAAGDERAARQPDHHRRARRTRRRPDVEVQAVLVDALDVEAREGHASRACRRPAAAARVAASLPPSPVHGSAGSGACHRRSPTGGAAYGMPRNAEPVTAGRLSRNPCTPPAGTGPAGESRRSVDRHPHPGVLGADPPRPGGADRGRRAAPRAQAATGDAAPRHRPSERAVLRHRRRGGHPRRRRSRRLDAHHRHVGAHAAGPGTRVGRHDDCGGAARWPLGHQHGRGHERPRCTRGHRGRQLRPGAAAPRRPAEAPRHLRGRGAALPGGGHPLRFRSARRRASRSSTGPPVWSRWRSRRTCATRPARCRARWWRSWPRPPPRTWSPPPSVRTSSWSTSTSATWPGPRPGRCAPGRGCWATASSPPSRSSSWTRRPIRSRRSCTRAVRPTTTGLDLSR